MRWKRFILPAVIIVVVAGGILYLKDGASRAAVAPRRFDTAQARYGAIDVDVTGDGHVQAAASYTVAPTVQGTVGKVAVAVGDHVSEGQTLATLVDDGTLKQQVLQAQAKLLADQRQLDQLLHPDPASDADVQAAQARLSQDQNRIESDQQQMADLTVAAPVAGRVSDLQVATGDRVQAGAALVTVVDTSQVFIDIDVPQEQINAVHVGDRANVTMVNRSGRFAAVVSEVGTQADPSAASSGGRGGPGAPKFPVTVRLSDPPSGLKAGATATVSIYPSDGTTIAGGGALRFKEDHVLTAGVAGSVATVSVSDGDQVAAGATLVTLKNDAPASQLASDQASLAEDRQALDHLLHPDPPDSDQVKQLQLDVQQDQLAVSQAQAKLAGLAIASPADGVVSTVSVAEGDRVSPGQALFQVLDAAHLQVVVNVDELDIAEVRVGQAAKVTADGLPGQTFAGTVAAIAPNADTSQGIATFPVTLDLSASDGLRPGMSASAAIQVAHKDRALLVPAEAVTSSGSKGTLRLLVDGRPQTVSVAVGLSNDTVTEITEGLKEGATVITAEAQANTALQQFGGRGGRDEDRAPGAPRGGSAGRGAGTRTQRGGR